MEQVAAAIDRDFFQRVNRTNKNGESLARYGMTRIVDHSINEKDDYENLLKDASWVVLGVVIGAVGNIWSLFV